MRRFTACIAGAVTSVALASPVQQASEALLGAAATYVARYERDLSNVIAEESYVQHARAQGAVMTTRQLQSELLLMNDDTGGWSGFRDVLEVDGKPVRDRDARLANLYLEPAADRYTQARRIADEGARFNLNVPRVLVARNINVPLIALEFLRASNQDRSSFSLEGPATVNGRRAVVVRFLERAKPRLIASSDDSAARGTFWLEPESGRVLQTELICSSATPGARTMATIRVSYAEEPRLRLWVPSIMEETYLVQTAGTLGGTMDGRAEYSNFRRFSVNVETAVTR